MNNRDDSPSATFFSTGRNTPLSEREGEFLSLFRPTLAMSEVVQNNIRVLSQAASQLLQKFKPGLAETRKYVYLNYAYLNIWKLY